ncbi:MAG TPA: methyltransferase type 11 [Armatimonadetes bacterium]|nr:methyltransferase type 11 [Armatimonadota bacterium]
MATWFENDAFWHALAPTMFRQKQLDAAVDEIDCVLALAPPGPGAAVLDMCCGPGRHSLELARRGYRVTGVDRTREFIDTARVRAQQEGLSVELLECDAREFSRPDTFDLAINLYTSFGYFADQDDDRRMARSVFEALKSGGRLVIEMIGKEIIARIFTPRDWEEIDDVILLQERRLADSWRWIDNRWILLRGEERHEFRFGHRLYSADELCRLLAEVGFAATTAYGSLAGVPYDQEAKRLVVVARKG